MQNQKLHKINLKLQGRYEGPYKIVEKVIVVVYVRERVHAVNMKSVARATDREPTRQSPHE